MPSSLAMVTTARQPHCDRCGVGIRLLCWLILPLAGRAAAQETQYVQPQDILSRKLSELRVDITPAAQRRLPPDSSRELFAAPPDRAPRNLRNWAESVVYWAPSEMVHQPLYFDDVPLERYGQTIHPALQPFLSGAHFFGNFPIIPYKIGIDRTHDRISTLGYYRPGSPTPCVGRRLPLELDASLLESGAWLGLIFLLP